MNREADERVRFESARDVLAVHGDLTIETAADVLSASEPHLDGDAITTVDLAGVEQCDSAALALMLEWQRRMSGKGVQVKFANVPPRLVQLGQISELENVLAF